MKKQPYQAYANATHTVSQTRQLLMLYDAVIRNLRQTKEAIAENRIEDRFRLITKTADIVFGLQSCLDFEKGGEVAKALYAFYSAVDARLFALHRATNPDQCDALIKDLKSMRDVWQEIDQNKAGEESADEVKPATTEEGDKGIAISA